VSPTQQTTYTVTGSNGGSCTGRDSVTIVVNPTPTVTATASPTTICPGGSSTLTGNGANIYQWSTQQNGQTIVVSPTATTTYFVAGYNGFNCRGIGQVDVTVDATNCSGNSGSRISSDDAQTQATGDNANGIVVYPNPSRGISYISSAPVGAVVEVFNQVGQKIVSGTIDNDSGQAEINLAQHTKGIYFVRISQSGKPVYQTRIVKEE
jgi:hypothetical protein